MSVEALVFEVEGERYALPAEQVREVVRAVAVARLPRAPEIVQGVIDVRGELVPVLDLRARFGLPPRGVDPSEHFVVARAGERTVAIRADRAVELATVDAAALGDVRAAVPDSPYVEAAARLEDGLVLIHDLRTFLAAAEAAGLDAALAGAAREAP